MTPNVPRLVTVQLGRCSSNGTEPLCTDEALVFVEELADHGVPAVRFVVDAAEATDGMLRIIGHARRRGLAPTVALRGRSIGTMIAPIAEAGAAAIAVPLHSHVASVHQAIEGGLADWSRSIALAGIVRDSGSVLEMETRVTPANALCLLPLMEEVEALHAAQWRLDFFGANGSATAATSAATTLLHAASHGQLRIFVHNLPQIGSVLARPFGRFRPLQLRDLTLINGGESMHVMASGDVRFDGLGVACAGNIRQSSIDVLLMRALSFASLRLLQAPRAVAAAERGRAYATA
jgi:hypothetical protein